MKVVWIPRRHRSLVYKLLILIPVAWLTIAFLLYNGNNINNEQRDPAEQAELETVIPGTAKPLVAADAADAVTAAAGSGEGSRYVINDNVAAQHMLPKKPHTLFVQAADGKLTQEIAHRAWCRRLKIPMHLVN